MTLENSACLLSPLSELNASYQNVIGILWPLSQNDIMLISNGG